jgi:outer membrane protein assembly factor BamC
VKKKSSSRIKNASKKKDEGGLSKDERRYRIRILPREKGAKVYIDYPDESVNNTNGAQIILKIIYEHLK